MNITIDQARALCSVVQLGGYTQAAHSLHKSHSSLIYLIRSMEEQCRVEFFNRTQYRNTLTPAGQQVYLKCVELLSKADEIHSLCKTYSQGWEPSIKIVYDGVFPFDPFLQIYQQFQQQKIPTVIQTYMNYLEDVESLSESIKADIILSLLPIKGRSLHTVHIKPLKSYLVAHKDHPLHQKNKKWSIEELKEFNFLTIRGSGKKLGLNTDDFERSASFFLSDFSVKKEAILKKFGFGWLPEHLIKKELSHKILLPLKWERESLHKLQPLVYVDQHKKLNPATAKILEMLREF